MNYVYFHGSFGSKNENWVKPLKKKLESNGDKFYAVDFPVEDWDELTAKGEGTISEIQTLDNWLTAFDKLYNGELAGLDDLCFIGHSLGPLFILHVMDRYPVKLKKAVFVSPFLTDIGGKWQFFAVNGTFYRDDFDFTDIRSRIEQSDVIHGDNDPYVALEFAETFAEKLGSEFFLVENGGHLNATAGFNRFPFLEDRLTSPT